MLKTVRFAASQCRSVLQPTVMNSTACRSAVRTRARCLLAGLLFSALPQIALPQVVLSQGTNISADVSPTDQRVAMDLLGSLWVMSARGGDAQIVSDSLLPVRHPRWSPDGRQILFETSSARGSSLHLLDLEQAETRKLSRSIFSDQQASWHPDGARIVYSSERHASGLDLWETDLATGLNWRISHHPGDETEPAWSANGRHLTYIRHFENRWSLMLRRHSQPDIELLVSDETLASPSWRPDGSLITFLQRARNRFSLKMIILSDPPLVMPFADDEDFFLAPVSWVDRQRLMYTADGMIMTRAFGDRRPRPLHFRARVGRPDARQPRPDLDATLPVHHAAESKFIIRGQRLFDGNKYRPGADVLIDGPRIVAVAPGLDVDDAVVLDLGNVTILPGYIDIYSNLPQGDPARIGARLLAYGVTTLVTDAASMPRDTTLWDSEETPGPRVLAASDITQADDRGGQVLVTVRASGSATQGQRSAVRELQSMGIPVLAESWTVGLGLGADLLLGADTLPSSPLGRRYQDMQIAIGSGPLTLVSGLADAGTPGLAQLLNSRQALTLGQQASVVRRFAVVPQLSEGAAKIVVGSKPNRLPAGLALHAELRALAAAGLPGSQVLQATGRTPAQILGLQTQIGSIQPGALADLILVSGDPIKNVSDTLNIVAVVRNGRFYSLVSLLERAQATANVE